MTSVVESWKVMTFDDFWTRPMNPVKPSRPVLSLQQTAIRPHGRLSHGRSWRVTASDFLSWPRWLHLVFQSHGRQMLLQASTSRILHSDNFRYIQTFCVNFLVNCWVRSPDFIPDRMDFWVFSQTWIYPHWCMYPILLCCGPLHLLTAGCSFVPCRCGTRTPESCYARVVWGTVGHCFQAAMGGQNWRTNQTAESPEMVFLKYFE